MGKMGAWSSFLKEFSENIQNEDYGFVFFENFDAFLGLAPSKLKKRIKGRLCVYRGIVLYQFQYGLWVEKIAMG